MPVLITPQEIQKVRKLAERKAGVTRQQVVERLKVTPTRAKSILGKIEGELLVEPLGTGRNCRTLIYRAGGAVKKNGTKRKPTRKARGKKARGKKAGR